MKKYVRLMMLRSISDRLDGKEPTLQDLAFLADKDAIQNMKKAFDETPELKPFGPNAEQPVDLDQAQSLIESPHSGTELIAKYQNALQQKIGQVKVDAQAVAPGKVSVRERAKALSQNVKNAIQTSIKNGNKPAQTDSNTKSNLKPSKQALF